MSLRLILLAVIVVLNGFFAAAEVALVSVRASRLKELAEQGNIAARAALGLLANPGRLLSTTQVGVTLETLIAWNRRTLRNPFKREIIHLPAVSLESNPLAEQPATDHAGELALAGSV